ncbi:hypothetical protein ACIPPS_23170 [Streptomyces sp. NPDC090127]|uniref:hypothetical protein n=1 Tax=Streptomyces sp. NPDC090127 TaxID=3365953 RepID=UPI00380A330A
MAALGVLVVPLGAGWLTYLWADWSLRGGTGTPRFVALLGGIVLAAVALAALGALFRETGTAAGFGLFLLVLGMGAAWVEVADSTTRSEVVSCAVVGKVRQSHHPTFGEGAPQAKTLYHYELDCPGGLFPEFSSETKADPEGAVDGEGGRIRVAYDPDRRMDPVLASENVAIGSPVIPTILLALSALASLVAIATEEREGEGV